MGEAYFKRNVRKAFSVCQCQQQNKKPAVYLLILYSSLYIHIYYIEIYTSFLPGEASWAFITARTKRPRPVGGFDFGGLGLGVNLMSLSCFILIN